MPRGGYRPFSGPRKGAKYLKTSPPRKLPASVVEGARVSDISPLEYMLAVMRDETQPKEIRDQMAIAAAPYVHRKAKPARFLDVRV